MAMAMQLKGNLPPQVGEGEEQGTKAHREIDMFEGFCADRGRR